MWYVSDAIFYGLLPPSSVYGVSGLPKTLLVIVVFWKRPHICFQKVRCCQNMTTFVNISYIFGTPGILHISLCPSLSLSLSLYWCSHMYIYICTCTYSIYINRSVSEVGGVRSPLGCWVQVVSSDSKWDQVTSSEISWVQVSPSEIIWVHWSEPK